MQVREENVQRKQCREERQSAERSRRGGGGGAGTRGVGKPRCASVRWGMPACQQGPQKCPAVGSQSRERLHVGHLVGMGGATSKEC